MPRKLKRRSRRHRRLAAATSQALEQRVLLSGSSLIPVVDQGVPRVLHDRVDTLLLPQAAVNGEFNQVVTGDFNGDGRADLLFHAHPSGNNRFFFTRPDGSFDYLGTRIGVAAVNGEFNHVQTGDFNGDGLDDIVFHAQVSGNNRFFYSRGDGNFDYVGTRIGVRGVNGEFDHMVVGDFDGNGVDDLLFHATVSGNNRWFLGHRDGRLDFSNNPIDVRRVNGEFDNVVVGDFNGDGRDDVLFHASGSGRNRWAYRNSDGSFGGPDSPIATGYVNSVFDNVVVADVNGDGLDDVVFHDSNSGYNRWFHSQGNGQFLKLYDNPIGLPAVNGEFNNLVAGEFNGDGADDLLFHAHPSGNNRFAFSRTAAIPALAGISIHWDAANHHLIIDGSAGDDHITVNTNGGVLQVNDAMAVGSAERAVRLYVNGHAGNDYIRLSGLQVQSEVHGHDGNDTIYGSEAADQLYGDAGDDVVDANGGHDFADCGDGDDHGNGGHGFDDVINCEDVVNAEPFEWRLAYRWAPVLYQDVDDDGPNSLNGRSDYISRIDFDGDWDTRNNWENAEHYPLPANAYYSVVTTASHWYIIYGFYHARDWSDQLVNRIFDQHENDMEGMLAIVKRGTSNGEPYGELQAIVTTFHQDFVSYIVDGGQLRPAHDPDLSGFRDAQDYGGILPMMPMTGPQGQTWHRPVLGQEAEGHGLLAFDIGGNYGERPDGGDTTWVRYDPAEHGAEPASPHNSGNVFEPQQITPYGLVNIFEPGGLWDHRFHRQTFGRWGRFLGDNGVDNAANAPWTWDDTSHWLTGSDDDGRPAGELAWDPASFADAWFDNEDFSRDYTDNPYRSDEAIVLHVNGFGGSPWSPVQGNSPHPQWGLQTRPIDANDVTGAHGIPQGHVHVANWNNFYGHGQPGNFEPQLEDGVCLVSPVLCGLLGVPDRYAPDPLTDDEFVADTVNFLNLYEGSDTVILIGHSFGADSLLRVVNQTNVEIDLLAISDPIGPFGTRAAVPDGVGHNVRYLYNRYQTEGVWPAESALAEIVGESVAKSYLSYASDAISNQARIDVPTASEGFFGGSHEYVPRSPEFRGEITRWDRWRANPGVDLGSISTQILSDGQQQRRTGSFPHCPPGLRCLLSGNDRPAPGFTITETNQVTQVSEFGSTDTFDVVLDAAPFSNVVLVVSADGDGEVRLEQSRLTFTPENWNAPQTVTVWGVDDTIVDGDQTRTLTARVDRDASDDGFDDLEEQSITVMNRDNDVPGFRITETGAATRVAESGSSDAFHVVLTAEPLSRVVLFLGGRSGDEVRLEQSRLTFTPENWNEPQTVTVWGVDDAIVDGDQTTPLTISIDSDASDDAFDGLAEQVLDVVTADDDVAIEVELTDGVLTIRGTKADDRIVIREQAGVVGIDGLAGVYDRDLIERLQVVALGGDDEVRNLTNLPLHADGGAGRDTIHGGVADDRIDGGDGNDVIFGFAGADDLVGGGGHDLLVGHVGNDTLQGDSGEDVLKGGSGNDRLFGGADADKLLSSSGDDVLFGEDGDDTLKAGTGTDELTGGPGNDSLYGHNGRDLILAGTGADTAIGGGGDDMVFGEAGDDRLRGGRGHDVLSGGTGEDDLDGGKGRDVMIAGEGADLVQATTADDIVVAGSTTLTRSELEVIRREWRSGRSFEERVGNIRDGSGAERRWNERAFLVAGRTVHNDDQVDTIISDNSGSDWVFASAQDEATIDQVFESLDVL